VIVLVILITNFLIRKIRGMMNISQIENKHIKTKEPHKVFKKILRTKEDISSLYEDEVIDSEAERVLFMVVEYSHKEDTKEEYEEAKVDNREELFTAIEVISREKRKNKKLQEELDKKEDTQELE
jgi:hypothetical protein